MAFHFRLKAVLHLRQSLEHQDELRLRAANQQVAKLQQFIEQIDARRQEWHKAQSGRLNAGMSAVELQFELLCDAELLRRRRELTEQLASLEQHRERQRVILQQARRAREILEAVSEKKRKLYQKESARREQRTVDDQFLMRREYLRRG